MKNSFDRINSKLNTAEERMNELGDRQVEIHQTETQRENRVWRWGGRTGHPREFSKINEQQTTGPGNLRITTG